MAKYESGSDSENLDNLLEYIKQSDISNIKTLISKNPHLLSDIVPGIESWSVFHILCINFYKNNDAIEFTLNIAKINGILSEIIDIKGKNGDTPLYLAVMLGSLNIIKLLIKHGANPYMINKNGNTILHNSVSNRKKPEILKYLLELLPDLKDYKDYHGWTPLKTAALMGGLEKVKILLEYGCSIDFDVEKISDSNIKDYLKEYQEYPP